MCTVGRISFYAAGEQSIGAAVQQQSTFKQLTLITPTAAMSADVHGGRAKCLQRLVRLDLPVPKTVALRFETVRAIAGGRMPIIIRVSML